MSKPDPREMQRLATYKDMAFRSLRYLYQHPAIGEEKLRAWVESWMMGFCGEAQLREGNMAFPDRKKQFTSEKEYRESTW